MNWIKSKLYGNIAENITEFLINSIPNHKCYKFGVETHIKEIKDLIHKNSTKNSIKIRKMPDFIVFNKKTNKIELIEVKYFSYNVKDYYIDFLEDYINYWEGTKLIIVRKYSPHFIYIDLDDVTPKCVVSKKSKVNKKLCGILGELNKILKIFFQI